MTSSAEPSLLCPQNLADDLTYSQADVDDMSDKAQTLAATSGDGRVVSQASQLAARYQARALDIKVTTSSILTYISVGI